MVKCGFKKSFIQVRGVGDDPVNEARLRSVEELHQEVPVDDLSLQRSDPTPRNTKWNIEWYNTDESNCSKYNYLE